MKIMQIDVLDGQGTINVVVADEIARSRLARFNSEAKQLFGCMELNARLRSLAIDAAVELSLDDDVLNNRIAQRLFSILDDLDDLKPEA